MTSYLLQHSPEDKADTPIVWTCLECEQTVEDPDLHTREHRSDVVEVFESPTAGTVKTIKEAVITALYTSSN